MTEMTDAHRALEEFDTLKYQDSDDTVDGVINLFSCDSVITIRTALQNADKVQGLVLAAAAYREADKFMVNIGAQYGFESAEYDRADDMFMACRKPLDEALEAFREGK